MSANLLWAPAPTKQLGDQDAELVIGVDPTSMVTCLPRVLGRLLT